MADTNTLCRYWWVLFVVSVHYYVIGIYYIYIYIYTCTYWREKTIMTRTDIKEFCWQPMLSDVPSGCIFFVLFFSCFLFFLRQSTWSTCEDSQGIRSALDTLCNVLCNSAMHCRKLYTRGTSLFHSKLFKFKWAERSTSGHFLACTLI